MAGAIAGIGVDAAVAAGGEPFPDRAPGTRERVVAGVAVLAGRIRGPLSAVVARCEDLTAVVSSVSSAQAAGAAAATAAPIPSATASPPMRPTAMAIPLT
jgi:hypothetical protein